MKKLSILFKKILNLFRIETYWKERIGGILGLVMYLLGNLLEIATSPNHTTSDPPVIWITGTLISFAVVTVSLSKYRQYTGILFKVFAYFINFNIILSFAESTISNNPDASFYLYLSYFVFFITSQLFDSRREILAITLAEMVFLGGAVYFSYDHHPALLQPLNVLIAAFVFVGNFVIGVQRLKLTQISGDSSIQFKAISENARDIQCIINGDFRFLYINPAVKEISGYSFADLSGKEFLQLVAEADQRVVL